MGGGIKTSNNTPNPKIDLHHSQDQKQTDNIHVTTKDSVIHRRFAPDTRIVIKVTDIDNSGVNKEASSGNVVSSNNGINTDKHIAANASDSTRNHTIITEQKSTTMGITTTSIKTVVTDNVQNHTSELHQNENYSNYDTNTKNPDNSNHTNNGQKQPKKKLANATPLPAADSGKDTITITSSVLAKTTGTADYDNADARADANKLYNAIGDLKKTLSANGILPAEANLSVKGLEDLNKLQITVNDDYSAKSEAVLKLQYKDHLGGSFNKGLGEVPVTHENMEKLTASINDATTAIRQKVADLKPGATVSQDEISAIVTKTIKNDLKDLPSH